MIKKLIIRNFQSHKKSVLRFSPGVNVITGPTDSGKTSIMRSLRWTVWNKPTGTKFRSNWGGNTSVTLEVDEGTVRRIRTDKENYYKLNNDIFKAFKAEPPDEIKNVLNLNEVNIQRQLDAPFLLSETPGKIASHFNWVAGLDKIDSSLTNINKDINIAKTNLKISKRLVKDKKKELEKYDFLSDVEEQYKEASKIEIKIEALRRNKNQLLVVIEQIEEIQKKEKVINKFINTEQLITSILNLIEKRRKVFKKKQSIEIYVSSIMEMEDDIADYNELIGLSANVQKVLQITEENKKASIGLNAIQQVVSKLQSTERNLAEITLKIKKLEKTFEKEMPNVCPLCGTNLKAEEQTENIAKVSWKGGK